MPITVSGTSITFNDSTVQTTAFTGGGGVTSLNGQTGAITNTGFDNIGSYALLANVTTSRLSAGTTIAGSNLRYASTVTSNGSEIFYSEGSAFSLPSTSWRYNTAARRDNTGNTGYIVPQGAATVSGTWRSMHMITERRSDYNPDDNQTSSFSCIGLFVRIS